MKHNLILLTLFVSIYACKKEVQIENRKKLPATEIKAAFSKQLPDRLLSKLSFEKAIRSQSEGSDIQIQNIPFANNPDKRLLAKTKIGTGEILDARVVELKASNNNQRFFEGSIVIESVEGVSIFSSDIKAGKILNKPHRIESRPKSLMAPDDLHTLSSLDVIRIFQRVYPNYWAYGNWLNTNAIFGETGGGISNDYTPYSGDVQTLINIENGEPVPLIRAGYETQIINPAINIANYIKCFTAVPDEGAVCSIELFVDIPVDNDPNKLFDWETESPGHTFLQIKKTNGTKTVTQNIGFYPKTNWKSIITPAPIDGKFVDNSGHEFNASLKINVTPAQLKSALIRIQYLANFIKYDIDEYNCSDFALEVFNEARSVTNKLVVPKYDIPGGMAPYGTTTPQGIYQKLKEMKSSGNPESANMKFPGVKGWAGTGNGPCN